MPLHVANVSAKICHSQHHFAFLALDGLRWSEIQTTADLVVLGVEAERWDFDIGDVLSNRHCIVIFLLVSEAEHLSVDMFIKHVHTGPVIVKHVLVVSVVFIAEVGLEGR